MYNLVKHCAHKTQDEEKHSKNNKHSIAQKTKSSAIRTLQKEIWGERKCSLRVNSSCFLLDTRSDTHIVRSDKCLVDDRETKEKISMVIGDKDISYLTIVDLCRDDFEIVIS
jgi:hypothetical protein